MGSKTKTYMRIVSRIIIWHEVSSSNQPLGNVDQMLIYLAKSFFFKRSFQSDETLRSRLVQVRNPQGSVDSRIARCLRFMDSL